MKIQAFTDGDPFQGIPGTILSADWLNTISAELMAVLTAAGLSADPANSAQLLAAIIKLMATATTQPAGDSSTKVATDQFVQTAIAGIGLINIAGNQNIALTQAQWGNGILIFIGALTANIIVTAPAQGDRWTVFNRSTGAFTVTVKTQNGQGVIVRPGAAYELICDGSDIHSISGGGTGKAARYFMATA